MQSTACLANRVIASASFTCSKIPHLAHHIARRQLQRETRRLPVNARLKHTAALGTNDGILIGTGVPYRGAFAAQKEEAPSIEDEHATAATTPITDDGILIDTPVLSPSAFDAQQVKATSDQSEHPTPAPAPVAQVIDEIVRTNRPISAADVVAYGPLVNAETMGNFLLREDPERLLFALLHGPNAEHFIKKADNEIFSATFCALDPAFLVEPFKGDLRFTSRFLVSGAYKFRGIRPLLDRMDFLETSLNQIVRTRETSNANLPKDVCRHLLKCAHVTGNRDWARFVWSSMMPLHRVKKDIQCHNEYMGAIVWNHAMHAPEDKNLLVTPHKLAIRARESRKAKFLGHQVSSPQNSQAGIRNQILRLFSEPAAAGHTGTEATFVHLMTAMAREGDLDGVKSILKSVWNINVDMLQSFDEEEIESVTFYEEGSPLRPSAKLLSCVVHSFCINSEVPMALSLMDYISRNYNLSIPREVWLELYEYATVHARRRRLWQKAQGWTKGQLTEDFVENLFNIMTDMPHHIKPNVLMYALRSKIRREKNSYTVFNDIDKAHQLVVKRKARLEMLAGELRRHLDWKKEEVLLGHALLPQAIFRVRREFMVTALGLEHDIDLIRQSLERTLGHTAWTKQPTNLGWEAVGVPNTVWKYGEYLPRRVDYSTASGKVELVTENLRDRMLFGDFDGPGKKTIRFAIIRHALDITGYDALVANLFQLREDLRAHDEREKHWEALQAQGITRYSEPVKNEEQGENTKKSPKVTFFRPFDPMTDTV